MSEPLTTVEAIQHVVAEAVWAPPVHNTQPWRFAGAGQEISLYADADRRLPVSDPGGREMMISCGAVIQAATSVRRPPEEVLLQISSEDLAINDE